MNTFAYFYIALAVFVAEILLQAVWIHFGKSQEQKKYGPQIDVEKKASTPSMGGIVFLVIGVGACFVSKNPQIWLFGVACGLIGFVDDALKFFRHSSEGFSSLKKLWAQIVVSLIFAVWYVVERGTGFFMSFLIVPLIIFLSVGFQNAVNVTDGLDGLAAGLIAISLAGFAVFSQTFSLDAAIFFGIVLGFLWHNCHPAKVFMGDTGSHFLAGVLFALVVAENIFLIIPVGFFFGIEIFTVALQIFAIHKLKRKIFKMAPLHHHFQILGWKETTIVARFWLVHIIGMALLFTIMKGFCLI